jgi:hypothetical protein
MAQISFSGKRELRWLQEGQCFVTFMEANTAIEDTLWDQWLAAAVVAPGKRLLLTSVEDIQPTKDQWRKATRGLRDGKIKSAVVTESRATSALAKAASWAGVDMLAFRWEQLIEACEHLGLDGPQRVAVRAAVLALRDSFGVGGARPSTSPINMPTAPVSARPSSRPAPTSPSAAGTRPSAAGTRPSAAGTRPSASHGSSSGRVTPSAPMRPTPPPGTPSRTPMADAASRNLAQVRQTSEEIQAKLAEIQARLRNRTRT